MKARIWNGFLLLVVCVLAPPAIASEPAFELTSNLRDGQAIPADYYANSFGSECWGLELISPEASDEG